MESEPNDSPPSEAIDLGFDTRSFETQHAVSVLQKYHDVMEAQIEEVLRCERVALVAERPENADEEDLQIFWSQQNYLEELFEHDLIPAMRYSFVVLMHIVFETRLRAFCSALQREREIAIAPNDLAGSAIDQARTYLTKLAHIPIGDVLEWQHLRRIQKIRNCIVHAHGFVAESGKEDEKYLRQLAKQNIGVAINESDARCPHNRRNHFIFDRFAHALRSRGSAFSFIASLHHPGHADHSAVFVFVVGKGLRAQLLPAKAGAETMVGKTATALTPIDSRGGRIFVEGEHWNAVSDTPIGKGDIAKIAAVQELTLKVQPAKGA